MILEYKVVIIFADNAVVPGIAHLYSGDRAKHDGIAAEWTVRFAKWMWYNCPFINLNLIQCSSVYVNENDS